MKVSISSMLLASASVSITSATYQLVQDYTGNAFFEGFDFFTEQDPSGGVAQYQSLELANATGLAGLIQGGNATNAVYLSVDSTNVTSSGRGAVRLQSNATFHHALVIADIVHMPGGTCGTWPAFWMVGDVWPGDGEIDIVEGVNDMSTNAMSLHTGSTSMVDNSTDYQGSLKTADCSTFATDQPENAGCSIVEESDLMFGNNFNTNGGGVYAMEWTSDSIKVWFFPRGQIPDDIATNTPNPSQDWGNPNSIFQGNFSMDDHFKDLHIVFDTDFCGSWADGDWNTSSCAALAPTCEEYVSKTPEAFKDAYWAINTLEVFQDDAQNSSSTNTSAFTSSRHRRSGGTVLPRFS